MLKQKPYLLLVSSSIKTSLCLICTAPNSCYYASFIFSTYIYVLFVPVSIPDKTKTPSLPACGNNSSKYSKKRAPMHPPPTHAAGYNKYTCFISPPVCRHCSVWGLRVYSLKFAWNLNSCTIFKFNVLTADMFNSLISLHILLFI